MQAKESFVPSVSIGRTLVMVPTYNERENVEALIRQIQALGLKLDLLFVDDHSPDGTGELLDQLAAGMPNLHVLHRQGKLGIGTAHQAGIRWAYEHGYNSLVTMDCDFTHPPEYIPGLLRAAEHSDIVVGSRYLQKKSLKDWNLFRKVLTTFGHILTRFLLKMPYDATGAFRFYRIGRIPQHAFDLVQSKGYSFFFESLYILHLNRLKITEIPITLPPRTYGNSKMDTREVWTSVRFLVSIYLTMLLNRERYRITEPVGAHEVDTSKQDQQGWDDYWDAKKGTGGLMYDTVAAFYRKFIIRRTLNHFIKKYFEPGANILHAGCGSGQVDTDIRHYISITGLDISVSALNFYKKTNQEHCKILHGSIFEIPLPGASVDGIYNLGVMEHFTEGEIRNILTEFNRVLRPGGRMVIFWPPEFGVSVIFFKVLTFIFKHILRRKNVKFHPDEITRVRSRDHVVKIFEASGNRVLKYYFGMMDLFTYSIIVAEKPAEKALSATPQITSSGSGPQPINALFQPGG